MKKSEWVGEWNTKAIKEEVVCIDPATYTDCGDILSGPLSGFVSDNVTVSCADNVCNFSCENDLIATYDSTVCRPPVKSKPGKFIPNDAVSCNPKPPDTPCGNVRDHFILSSEVDFETSHDRRIVIFKCPQNQMALPSSSNCNGNTFQHKHGTQISCH